MFKNRFSVVRPARLVFNDKMGLRDVANVGIQAAHATTEMVGGTLDLWKNSAEKGKEKREAVEKRLEAALADNSAKFVEAKLKNKVNLDRVFGPGFVEMGQRMDEYEKSVTSRLSESASETESEIRADYLESINFSDVTDSDIFDTKAYKDFRGKRFWGVVDEKNKEAGMQLSLMRLPNEQEIYDNAHLKVHNEGVKGKFFRDEFNTTASYIISQTGEVVDGQIFLERMVNDEKSQAFPTTNSDVLKGAERTGAEKMWGDYKQKLEALADRAGKIAVYKARVDAFAKSV